MTKYRLHLSLVQQVSSSDEGLDEATFNALRELEDGSDHSEIHQVLRQVRFSFTDSVLIIFIGVCGVLKIAESLITYWR
jgi:hypothetical protein